jgi:uncharacterized protein DUF4177
MMTWEYKIAQEVGQMKEAALNSFGAQGWELVTIHREWIENIEHRHAAKVVYTFKRPLDPLCQTH